MKSKIYYVMLAILMGMSGELFAMDMPVIQMPDIPMFTTEDLPPCPARSSLADADYEKYLDGLNPEQLVAEGEKVDDNVKVAEKNYADVLYSFWQEKKCWEEAGSVPPRPEPGRATRSPEYSAEKQAIARKAIFDAKFRKEVSH